MESTTFENAEIGAIEVTEALEALIREIPYADIARGSFNHDQITQAVRKIRGLYVSGGWLGMIRYVKDRCLFVSMK